MKAHPEAVAAPWGMVALLLAANTISFVDRMLLTLLVGPIRAELMISDTQISLLHGFAFAAFYALAGLPLGRIADQGDRPRLMSIGVSLWSCMTAVCGFAGNFATLFAARVGVAVGEASLSPAAISLITQRFARSIASRAIATFQSGIFIGTALAMLGGGALLRWFEQNPVALFADMSPWRLVFVAVSAPGLLIGLSLLFVAEPRRGRTRDAGGQTSIRKTFAHIGAHKSLYGGHFLAFTAITILAYGSLSWMPSVLVRAHGMSTPDAGALLGFALLIAGPIGVISSGALADAFAKRAIASGAMLVATAAVLLLAVATPLYALAPSLELARLSALLLAFAQSFPYGVASASIAMVTPAELRGQIVALYLMVSNLFGLTLGPLLVALATDRLFQSDEAVGQSLALLPLLTTPLALAGLALCWKSYQRAWRALL